MKYDLRIVFFGSSNYVIPIIEVLIKNFNLVLVLTTENNKNEPVFQYCTKHNIKFRSVKKLDDNFKSYLLSLKSSAAVLANFGILISKDVLSIFPQGIINIHPSLLPKYRGSTPVQTAILNGDKTTGVTLIKLDNEVDHGSILAQTSELIAPDDTAESLYKRLFQIGADLIEQNFKKYLEGEIKLKEQDHTKATFTKTLTRTDGYFDISKPPSAETLNRMAMAYYSWPGVWTKFRGSTRGVGAQKIVKLLPGKKIQVEGKKPMSYKDFINGYKEGKEIIKKITNPKF